MNSLTASARFRPRSGCRLWLAAACCAAAFLMGGAGFAQEPPPAEPAPAAQPAAPAPQPAAAQEPAPPPRPSKVFEREPFDRITLDRNNGSRVLEVELLELPERRRPAEVRPGAKLRFKMLDRPDRTFEVFWRSIEKLELYEEMVLAEAEQLVAERKYDEAYEYFRFLMADHPNTLGLSLAVQRYLFLDAGRLYQEKRFAEALAVLEELHRLNPTFKQPSGADLSPVMGVLVEQLLQGYVAAGDYAVARQLLTRLAQDHGRFLAATLDRWKERFEQAATAKQQQAAALAAAGRHREASAAATEMLRIWPQLAGGREFAEQIAQQYPLVVVGVEDLATTGDASRLDDWTGRRVGRLLERRLLEFEGLGPEGGQYECPVGTVRRSEDGRQLQVAISPARFADASLTPTGYQLAERLLLLAEQPRAAGFRRLVSSVAVDGVLGLTIDLTQTHLMPESFLQVALGDGDVSDQPRPLAPYRVGRRDDDEVQFVLNSAYVLTRPGQPREVIERRFAAPELAVDALRKGVIDIIDRVPPPFVEELQQDDALTVAPYAAPTVHLLVANLRDPYLKSRTFRRALLTAIDRETLLSALVLEGRSLPGFRVLSGPFPASTRSNDPLAYAYDENITPRPYSAPLAAVLVSLAAREFALLAEKKKEEPPQRPKLVLAHPARTMPRLICTSIEKQLTAIGLEVERRELPPGAAHPTDDEWDLLYKEVFVYEPVVDARRLLAEGGVAGSEDPYIALALRELDAARNWREAGERLRALHRVVYDEATVLPLWQTVEHYAHHRGVEMPTSRPVSLYQGVEQWRVAPRLP